MRGRRYKPNAREKRKRKSEGVRELDKKRSRT